MIKLTPFPRGILYGKPGTHDRKSLTALCHEMARAIPRTTLLKKPKRGMRDKYWRATLSHEEESVDLLCQVTYPLIALVQKDSLEFIDLRTIELFLSNKPDWHYLPANYLKDQYVSSDLVHLDQEELDYLKYWDPTFNGNLLFRCWD